MLTSPELATILSSEGAEAETMTPQQFGESDAFGNGAMDQGRAPGQYFDRLTASRATNSVTVVLAKRLALSGPPILPSRKFRLLRGLLPISRARSVLGQSSASPRRPEAIMMQALIVKPVM